MTKRSAPAPATPTAPSAPADLLSWPTPWICGLIFVLTFVVYLPALNGGMLWDDGGHVTKPELQSLAGLGRIWFELGATQQYYPLLHSAFWLEHQIWGDATAGYHLVNILLHATAACLAGVLLRRLAVPGAWLAALLFALHPVCVESVAWITEQKNTLSLVLYLCAALAYLRFDTTRRPAAYACATLLFVCALLTKTVTATLPAALLVIFWWQRQRIDARRDLVPLLPWFALALAGGLLTAWVEQTLIGAQGSHFALRPIERGLVAGRVIWFYLGKILWPAELVFIYPRWMIDAGAVSQFLFPLAVFALIAGLWLRKCRGPLAGFLFFAGSLFPALGFFNVYPFIFSFVADHFQYLPSLGILACIAAGLALAIARWPRRGRAGSVALLALLGVLTWRQSGMYRDVFTLYETTLRQNPDCWMAHNNLAEALTATGRPADAIPHLEAALKLHPDFPEAENNLGDDLRRIGRPLEAILHFEKALAMQPKFAEALSNYGVALMALNRADEGIARFESALRLEPDFVTTHFNLGLALASTGHPADAIKHFAEAVRLQPGYAEAELYWANALTLSGRPTEALVHYENSLRLDPNSVRAYLNYGRVLADAGRYDDAIARYRRAVELDPNSADAHLNLAVTLRQMGQLQEAQEHYQTAQRLSGRN